MADKDRIAGYRTMAGLTQKEMAQALDMSYMGYRNKELGKSEFKRDEMHKFTEIVKRAIPEITAQEIFFD